MNGVEIAAGIGLSLAIFVPVVLIGERIKHRYHKRVNLWAARLQDRFKILR